jgi:cobalt-zinc-cadmium efflux system membrane fusion protein
MFGAARVTVRGGEEVLAVPEAAVQTDGCCSLVFVRQSDTLYRPRKVMPGAQAGGYVEVLDGLKEGELLVTTGSFLMKTEILKGSIGAGCCEVEPGR